MMSEQSMRIPEQSMLVVPKCCFRMARKALLTEVIAAELPAANLKNR